MLSELERATRREAWIVFSGWTPHWMNQVFDIAYLDDPEGIWGEEGYVGTLVNTAYLADNPNLARFFAQFAVSLPAPPFKPPLAAKDGSRTSQGRSLAATKRPMPESAGPPPPGRARSRESRGGQCSAKAMTPLAAPSRTTRPARSRTPPSGRRP